MRTRAIVVVAVIGCLVGGLLAPAEAAKKKKKPSLVQVDQKMFLGAATACAADQIQRSISLVDGQDLECWYTRAGLVHDQEALEGAPAPAGQKAWSDWTAIDGVPLKLDASKSITGEISTGGACGVLTNVDCLPVGVSAGTVKLMIKFVGVAGGEEITLGEQVDEFTATPGPHHTTMVNIALDSALKGVEFTEITLWTRIGGASAGHGVYKLVDPSSFVTIPTLAAAS